MLGDLGPVSSLSGEWETLEYFPEFTEQTMGQIKGRRYKELLQGGVNKRGSIVKYIKERLYGKRRMCVHTHTHILAKRQENGTLWMVIKTGS